MDRPIADSQLKDRRYRRIAIFSVSALLLTAAFFLLFNQLRPSVKRTRIRTAMADLGPVQATIAARGHVMPEHEHIITSPIDTRVMEILKLPGSCIAVGEPILALDVNASRLALEKLDDRIALQENARQRAQVSLERELADLTRSQALQKLELKTCRYRATRDRELLELGVCSDDQSRTSETEVEKAAIELDHLTESINNAKRAVAVQLAGLDLEIDILRKDRDDAAHRLALATPTSDRAGILTWVVPSEGTALRQGDEIARIADLNSFRIDATVSDVHAARLSAGQSVEIHAGEKRLQGQITHIRPTVENGVLNFEVGLDDKSNAVLRHNLRVDVYVVTDYKEEVIRIRRGAYVRSDGSNAVFVIRNDRAYRTPVTFGITNYEFYEVLTGLVPGDEVIISDMSDRMHLQQVRLR
jgi:HlyD family secretion protein